MTTTERKELLDAVLTTRDSMDPDLESELLIAIVDAERAAGGDVDVAKRAIDAAVTAAIGRGVGSAQDAGDLAENQEDED